VLLYEKADKENQFALVRFIIPSPFFRGRVFSIIRRKPR
jgi:hypothetical protein